MAHEMTRHDGLLLVGEPAWHNLGVRVPRGSGIGIREGFRRVVRWDPQTTPLVWSGDEGGLVSVPDALGVVATYPAEDKRPARYLATVGADYKLVNHDALLSLAEAAEGAEGVELEAVGTTHSGRRIFLLLKVGTYGLGLNREDQTSTYLALLNSFDGSTAVRGFGTEVRIVCANTYAAALGRADSEAVGFRVLHSGEDIGDCLDIARQAIAAGRLQLARMEEENRALADSDLTTGKATAYFGRVASILFPAVAMERPRDAKEGEAWERQRERARATVAQWMAELEHERQALVAGTAYAALEAVTYWADHQRPRVRESAADKLTGRGARIKLQARELAMELAGASAGPDSVPIIGGF